MGYPIDTSSLRFIKRMTWPEVPKPGTIVSLTAAPDQEFTATVTRSDWNEELAIFRVSCRYSKRSISPEHCAALLNDAEWVVKPLL